LRQLLPFISSIKVVYLNNGAGVIEKLVIARLVETNEIPLGGER